ncbi:transporter, cation channel family protein, partial [Cooperia oncophora]
SLRSDFLSGGLTAAAFDDVVSTQEVFNNIAAVVLFLSWIKTMNQLAATLSRSTKDIGGFAVMFAVFFFAYAQFGYLVFGTQIADYSTFLGSVFALLRTVLGDFDFHALEQTNRVLGPLFFVTYVFFVFFVLLNMFLAIINDSYVEVKAELARQNDGDGIFDWIRQNMFLAIINDSYVEVKAELARQNDGDGIFDWIRQKVSRGKKDDKKVATYNDYKIDLLDVSGSILAGYNEKVITDAFEKLNISLNDEVSDEALIEVGNEIKEQVERQKIIDEEYRSTAV